MKFLYGILIFLCFCAQLGAEEIAILAKTPGGIQKISKDLEDKGEFQRLYITASSIPKDATSVEIRADFAKVKSGDEGYFLFPNGFIIKFRERRDAEYKLENPPIALSGMSRSSGDSFAAIVKGMELEYSVLCEIKEGVYSLVYCFDLERSGIYEDIIIDFYKLPKKDNGYSAMGRIYRGYKLSTGAVRPLKERVANNKYVEYASKVPEIRVHGSSANSTSEGGEAKKVSMGSSSLSKVGDILGELKAQGVDSAEICLVDWETFDSPGEGEENLRSLIRKAQEMGYQIVCQTSLEDRDSPKENVSASPSKSLAGAGKKSAQCHKISREEFLKKTHERVADLGFRGLHYVEDVSRGRPEPCLDKSHPIDRREASHYSRRILSDVAEKIGGVASGGPFDYNAEKLDYVLYVTRNLSPSKWPQMVDDYVPVWHIVYNGIILNNPGISTVNWSEESSRESLKLVEYGGRPSYCFYQVPGGGDEKMPDGLGFKNKDELKSSVAKIKKGADLMKRLAYLQFEFLDSHEEVEKGVFISKYSDGTEIVCNYGDSEYVYRGESVNPLSFKVYKPSFWGRLWDL